MKYVLLGNLAADWATKHAARTKAAKAKLKELGIKLVYVHYTQGYYDFVDVVDAPSPEAVSAFSVWYVHQGYGRVQSMPAFDDAALKKAVTKAVGT